MSIRSKAVVFTMEGVENVIPINKIAMITYDNDKMEMTIYVVNGNIAVIKTANSNFYEELKQMLIYNI